MKKLYLSFSFIFFGMLLNAQTTSITLELSCLPGIPIVMPYKSGSDCTTNTYEKAPGVGTDGYRISFNTSSNRWEILLLEPDNPSGSLAAYTNSVGSTYSPNPPSNTSYYIGNEVFENVVCDVTSISGAVQPTPTVSGSGDSDGDGVPNACDVCTGNDATGDADSDGICNDLDICPAGPDNIDSDGDGTPDACDACPNDPGKTSPGICGCGVSDADTDSDGTPDCIDGCPNDPGKISPGICGCGVSDADTDSDGTADCNDGCPNDPGKTSPGICGCGISDADTDSDGTPDCNDGCPNDPGKISPGICGCGVSDADADSDGTPDCNDGCPNDPGKISPGICGCGVSDADADSDGTPDCNDGCPNDPLKTEPGECGCSVVESNTDADSDGKDDACDGDGFTVDTAIDVIFDLISDFAPKKGSRRSLNNQLGSALNACSNGDEATAVDELAGFINHVEAKRGKDFNNAEADVLIEAAMAIRAAIISGEADCGGGTSRQAHSTSLRTATPQQLDRPLLHNNYPNPFSKETRISFYLPEEMNVRLRVFDLMGREIQLLLDGRLPAGEHQVNWESGRLDGGVYIYRLEAREFIQSKRLIIKGK